MGMVNSISFVRVFWKLNEIVYVKYSHSKHSIKVINVIIISHHHHQVCAPGVFWGVYQICPGAQSYKQK